MRMNFERTDKAMDFNPRFSAFISAPQAQLFTQSPVRTTHISAVDFNPREINETKIKFIISVRLSRLRTSSPVRTIHISAVDFIHGKK